MKELLLKIITLIHLLFVLFIIGVPFINSNYLLFVHVIIVPFIVLHWICNDNTCVLTLVEKKLRKDIYGDKYNKDDCITCKLIEPVYDFRKNYKQFSRIIYTITFILWSISLGRLLYKYKNNEITTYRDLFLL